MSHEAPEPATQEAAHTVPRLYGIGIIIAAVVLSGLWLITRFTAFDLGRDMQTWQEKLNLVAESRTADINHWVSGNFQSLRALASNPSLQLYLTELDARNDNKQGGDVMAESGQKTYLRNLILFTAEQSGFSTPNIPAVNANIPREGKNALAVLNNNYQVVVSTAMSPAMTMLMALHAKNQPPGQEYLIDAQKDADGNPYIGFIAPIFSIQGERNASSQIGLLVGIKPVDESFFARLKHPGIMEETLETILVRQSGKKLDYISPLLDGSGVMAKQVDYDLANTAEAALMKTVGDFTSEIKDYRDNVVLATSRAITGTPWKLIVKVDRSEALAKSSERRAGMILLFFMIVAIVALVIATMWWYAHSKRAMMLSRHFRRMAAKTRAQEQLLRLVTDHQPEPIYIVDTHQTYHFANQQVARDADMSSVEFIVGKTLNDVRGVNRAEYIHGQCGKALKAKRVIYDIAKHPYGKEEKVIRSAFVPMAHIPVASLPEPTPGVLVVEQDISEIMHERERRMNAQNHLIETLVRLVDKRDPFAANHSLLVSQLAHKIAQDMGLTPALVETARVAGCLMNIGKIIIPPNLLTKSGTLTGEERQAIQESMHVASSIIKDIDFDGPVAETLKQWQEKWDGTGPLGLRGEAILVSARIIAVANAFIGMISPRSWRTAIPIESATKFLLDQSDAHFDRRVVIALMNYVENHHGRAWIEKIMQSQRAA